MASDDEVLTCCIEGLASAVPFACSMAVASCAGCTYAAGVSSPTICLLLSWLSALACILLRSETIPSYPVHCRSDCRIRARIRVDILPYRTSTAEAVSVRVQNRQVLTGLLTGLPTSSARASSSSSPMVSRGSRRALRVSEDRRARALRFMSLESSGMLLPVRMTSRPPMPRKELDFRALSSIPCLSSSALSSLFRSCRSETAQDLHRISPGLKIHRDKHSSPTVLVIGADQDDKHVKLVPCTAPITRN